MSTRATRAQTELLQGTLDLLILQTLVYGRAHGHAIARIIERRSDEVLQHIETETRENIEAGMSPDEARLAARRKFGNVLLAAEQSRTFWGGLWLESVLLDVRYAIRHLKGSPGYAATLVCTLVLGLGAVTAMMAIIESILLRPVRLPHSDQLVVISAQRGPNGVSGPNLIPCEMSTIH